MKEKDRTYCPFCKKHKAEWYSKIGFWSNVIVAHCLKCGNYFIDEYSSSIDQDSNCTIVNDYYSITKELYKEFIKDETKAKNITDKHKYGTAEGFRYLERIIEHTD